METFVTRRFGLTIFLAALALIAFAGCGGDGQLGSSAADARWEGAGVTVLEPGSDPDGARIQVDVGDARVGVGATALLRIHNDGRGPLALVAKDPPAALTVTVPETIPPGGSGRVELMVRPSEPGRFRLLLTIRAGSIDELIRIVGRAITDGDDPGTDDPGTDDPSIDDPSIDDPGTDDPGTDPGTDDPGTDDPGTDDPGTDDPGEEPACWEHSDAFQVERKIDVLWVIDSSGSANGVPLLPPLWNEFVSAAAGVDYQVGVTTTGLTPVWGGCPGGANGGENGRLFPVDGSTPRIISSLMPMADQAATWAQNSWVGDCHFEEQPYEAALRALSPPLIDHADDPRTPEANDGNLGLLRQDADLAIVVITDESDQSYGFLPADYVAFFQSLKPGAPEKVKLHAITGELNGTPAPCFYDPGDRLIFGVNATGGSFFSICTPYADYPIMLQSLSQGVFGGVGATYFLATVPEDANADGIIDERDLEVRQDGAVVPRMTPTGETAWTYDPSTNAIRFEPLSAPGNGSEVVVTYRVPCEVSD